MRENYFTFHKVKLKLILIVLFTSIVYSCFIITAKAVTDSDYAAMKDEMTKMILEGDRSVHDFSAYQITYAELSRIYSSMITEPDIVVAYYCNENLRFSFRAPNNYINNIWLTNLHPDFDVRYPKLKAFTDEVLSGIDDRMSEFEKVLYLHDYICNYMAYDTKRETPSYYVYGSVERNTALCGGYAQTLIMLLRQAGLKAEYVVNSTHAWAGVYIDGEYYNIDPTFDDPYPDMKGRVLHRCLLMNDAETAAWGHSAWNNFKAHPNSTSTRFSNSFYATIKSPMFYYDGRWYYIDPVDERAVSCKIVCEEGEAPFADDIRVLHEIPFANSLTFIDLENSTLHYTIDGEPHELDLSTLSDAPIDEETVVVETPTNEISDDIIVNDDDFFDEEFGGEIIDDIDGDSQFAEESNGSPSEDSPGNENNMYWNDISHWRSGQYSMTSGNYQRYDSRICLNEYISCDSNTEYRIILADKAYRMLIRELDCNQEILASHNLTNEDTFTTSEDCSYLAISIYNASDSSISFDMYVSLFETDGFSIGLLGTESADSPDEELTETRYTLDLNDAAEWRSGQYGMSNGRYEKHDARICFNDYVEAVPTTEYTISLSHPSWRLLIRELNSENEFIKSYNLCNGDAFITDSSTRYLAFSIYDSSDSNATYDSYIDAFSEDADISLSYVVSSLNIEDSDTPLSAPYQMYQRWIILFSTLCIVSFISITLFIKRKNKL